MARPHDRILGKESLIAEKKQDLRNSEGTAKEPPLIDKRDNKRP